MIFLALTGCSLVQGPAGKDGRDGINGETGPEGPPGPISDAGNGRIVENFQCSDLVTLETTYNDNSGRWPADCQYQMNYELNRFDNGTLFVSASYVTIPTCIVESNTPYSVQWGPSVGGFAEPVFYNSAEAAYSSAPIQLRIPSWNHDVFLQLQVNRSESPLNVVFSLTDPDAMDSGINHFIKSIKWGAPECKISVYDN
jgi:hypothetical protein